MGEVAVPRTLADLCGHLAQRHGERTAALDGHRAVTYHQFAAEAGRAADSVRGAGVAPGDRVLLSGPNSVDWAVAAFGVLQAGATLVPANHRLGPRDRARVLEVTAPRLVVAADARDWSASGSPAVDLPVLLDDCPSRIPGEPGVVGPTDTALVMQTSGTTGAAKFVPMRHGPLLRLYSALAPRLEVGAGDVLLGVAPLAHGFGLFGVLLDALLTGATARLVPHYDRDRIAEVVVADGVTALFCPFAVFHDLAAAGLGERAHRCRVALTGGAEVSLPRFREVCARLGVNRLKIGYGMTEAYGTVAFGDVSEAAGDVPPLDPLPGLEVCVADPLGRELPPGEAGEVLVRGDSVVGEYVGTADHDLLDPDGWLHTGDLGSLHRDGRLRILGRLKETVIVNGFNVVPVEVESVLESHPGVRAAAVVGIPDGRTGERLVGCVVPTPGRTPTEAELLRHARDRLTGYKVPSRLILVEQLPTTTSGKRARSVIREEVLRRLSDA